MSDHDTVGGVPRPPRLLTVGRRREDRWIVRAGFAVFFLMAVFVVYTSLQQHFANDERDEIISRLEKQNQDLLCFAINTQTFEVVTGEYLLSTLGERGPLDDPEVEALRRVQEGLRQAQEAQLQAGLPSQSGVCVGPPATIGTTTTTG